MKIHPRPIRFGILRTLLGAAAVAVLVAPPAHPQGLPGHPASSPFPSDSTQPPAGGPSLLGPFAPGGARLAGTNTVTWDPAGNRYLFRYDDTTGATAVEYELDLDDPNVQMGMLSITENRTQIRPVTRAGPSYRDAQNNVINAYGFATDPTTTTLLLSHRQTGDTVFLLFEDQHQGVSLRKEYRLQIHGRTLVCRARKRDARAEAKQNYVGWRFDREQGVPNATYLEVPYAELSPVTIANGQTFVASYQDWLVCHSNSQIQAEGPNWFPPDGFEYSYFCEYQRDQAGEVPVLDETLYITVSDAILDVLPSSTRPPSPYHDDLARRVTWDVWWSPAALPGVPGATVFDRLKWLIRRWDSFGMRDLLIIVHDWQRFGFDCGLPTHYPANPSYGGMADLADAVSAARSMGSILALHEDYTSMYANSTYWDPALIAVDANGAWKTAWNNPACIQPKGYRIRAEQMVALAQQESQFATLGNGAAFLDITPSVRLDKLVDLSVSNPNARTFRDVYSHSDALNTWMRAAYGGPVLGEGGQQLGKMETYYAGSIDGIERELFRRECAPVVPDFEAQCIRPRMVGGGMGYHGRWYLCVPDTQITSIPPSLFPYDKLMATQIAYGHAGFVSESGYSNSGLSLSQFDGMFVREYYRMHAIQKQTATSAIDEILYLCPNGSLQDLSEAIRRGADILDPRLREHYDCGVQAWINRSQSQPWTVSIGSTVFELPPNGWAMGDPAVLGIGAGGGGSQVFVAQSSLVDASGNPDPSGHRVDYVCSPDYELLDGRGTRTRMGNLDSTWLTVRLRGGLTLREDAGGNFHVRPLRHTQATD